ncbi:MAG TPA: polysaccharide deacetylase family protein [Dongiaceae bacterium]
MVRLTRRRLLAAGAAMAALGAAPVEAKESGGPLYLTIDTGWMNYAEKMAEILQKRRIVGTCFVANEATFRGDKTLDDSWGDFWRARAAEGFRFGSHTWRHWYFRGDVGVDKVRYVKWGNGESEDLDAAAVGRELHQPVERIKQLTGKDWLPLWRAPGGKTTARVIEMARQAGFRHQGWTDAGYLGDDLPSDKYPNQALLKRAMRDIKSGDVLLLHWGIHDRADKFINVLDDLLAGLQDKGFHFDHLPMKVT